MTHAIVKDARNRLPDPRRVSARARASLRLRALGLLCALCATALLAGPGQTNLENAPAGQGGAVTLPLKVKLDNPLLATACYIGSNTEPVVLNLTTGTTSPPPPNKPISGAPGHASPFPGRGK